MANINELTPEERVQANAQDAKIWNNGKEYFIQEDDFDPDIKTQHTPGSELTVYSDDTKHAKDFYFVSQAHNWINYKPV